MRTKATNTVHVLGVGVLNWPSSERRSDRYGCVMLSQDRGQYVGGEHFETVESFIPIERNELAGTIGKLTAEILETRESQHIGDLFRGLFPKTPNIGDCFLLGTGRLFYEPHDGCAICVGVRPADGRNNDWLNPEALYQCHDQTVKLHFEEIHQ